MWGRVMKNDNYILEHQELLNNQLGECTLFLKRNGEFPLSGPCKIAAYGSGVRRTVKGGTGSGDVLSKHVCNVEEGLENEGFQITTKNWLDRYEKLLSDAKREYAEELFEESQKRNLNPLFAVLGVVMPEPEYSLELSFDAECAIYVLARVSGEGNDRNVVNGDIFLSKTEIRDIQELNNHYKKFMLVLNTGGPVDLSPVEEVENILVLSQLGADTGKILAEILLGKQNPSGKLTTTWSKWEDYCPEIDFGNIDNTFYREGIYVGYRYFDTVGKKAMFPFGYGLSYTDFKIAETMYTVEKGIIHVEAVVENTGRYKGKEVIQLYATIPEDKLPQPYQSLIGFAKTRELEPGEKERISVDVPVNELCSYSEECSAYIMEKGCYIIRLGQSSTDTEVAGTFYIDETVVVKEVSHLLDKNSIAEVTYKRNLQEDNMEDRIKLKDKSVFHVDNTVYSNLEKKEEFESLIARTAQYTDEELVLMNLGSFSFNDEEKNVIGNAGIRVAGAAGDISQLFEKKEHFCLTMADGPAGLRLSPMYYQDEKGVHSLGTGSIPETALDLLPDSVAEQFRKPISVPKGAKIKYQYTTALPIGTALAQSWNLDFAQLCGDIVGREMEMFHIQLWLAPALNIHRSIRNGRNFEYFSEDPLVSGKMAAAMTKGVQSHPECGVTIKHFAANNQEVNRMNSNSIMSERTLREIYLKGFSICIQEAAPAAVMTSYNLINGVHTSEMQGLCKEFLREENRFEGLIMTDWMVEFAMPINQHWRHAVAHKIAKAGCSLLMPGEEKDYKELKDALENGLIDREQLRRNIYWTIKTARSLNCRKMYGGEEK